MKKQKFTEAQIVKALKEHEAGREVQDIARELALIKLLSILGERSMEVCRLKSLKD